MLSVGALPSGHELPRAARPAPRWPGSRSASGSAPRTADGRARGAARRLHGPRVDGRRAVRRRARTPRRTPVTRSARRRGAGLRFLPGALPALLGVPAAALRNARVPLDELLPGPARGGAGPALEAGEDPVGRARRARRPAARRRPGPIRACRAAAADCPACALGGADRGRARSPPADALGCTRALHRRCLAAFGYGPADAAPGAALPPRRRPARAGVSPADVAARAGYADQPHLSRETRALAGASPGQLASGANRSTPLPSGSSTMA